jgi:hypothetical protein
MITARNYAAQAEFSLRQGADIILSKGMERDNLIVRSMVTGISNAIHFAIPDGGRLFDQKGEYKGLEGIGARLPYRSITIEFFGGEKFFMKNAKVVVLAIENIDDATGSFFINIFPMVKVEGANVFIPGFKAVRIPEDWSGGRGVGGKGFMGTVVDILEDHASIPAFHGADRIFNDLAVLSGTVCMNLLDALSCSNVSSDQLIQKGLPPLVAQRRARKGKLPIYETKILTVNTEKDAENGNSNGGSHASPRTHLRRGHIRRIDDNRRIWVNACVVGKSGKGIIDKQYVVR